MVRISDKEILKALIKDGRASFTDIAESLGVSESAIRKRVRRMEKEGKIKEYRVEVDPKALGYSIDSIIGIDATPEKFLHIIDWLKRRESIIDMWTSTGDHMVMFRAWFVNRDSLYAFIKQLESMDGVTKVCPAILIEKVK